MNIQFVQEKEGTEGIREHIRDSKQMRSTKDTESAGHINDIDTEAGRLLVVSNRLPFTATEVGGDLQFQGSAGGVASGLSAYFGSADASISDYLWIGWPGGTIQKSKNRATLRQEALDMHRSYPVFLSEVQMENFYHGFCNKIVWPLFHYFPSYAQYKSEYWEHYKHVNEAFCAAVVEAYRPGDTIWVHDYHLMLLPGLLRRELPDAKIGFFLHIPFPAYEIFQLIPDRWRAEILQGLLGADLVGFHAYGYTHNFLRSVLRTFGYEHNLGLIKSPTHRTKADTFPMGINFEGFHTASRSEKVEEITHQMIARMPQTKLVLSIDRLDYTKGIINRLEAFELFLERHPEWRGRVTLALVTVPSRVAVEHYRQTRSRIEALVGHINGRFGSMLWSPVTYQYRSLGFEELIGMYKAADVALVTPLRDGMNLIAKEYIASQTSGEGVLILSETAGAAGELGEAIIINPNSRDEIADAIKSALEMPASEQRRRNETMQQRLRAYDIRSWAGDFLEKLNEMQEEQNALSARALNAPARTNLVAQYRSAQRRLILLDYDGTLTGYAVNPSVVAPTGKLMMMLERLAQDPANDVVLISGRDKHTLEEWFGGLPIDMVAEHGLWAREKAGDWTMLRSIACTPDAWKHSIRPILDLYTNRLPGSLVEEKDFSLAWHYRGADPEHAHIRTSELLDHLLNFTMNRDMQILLGNKVIEVRQTGVSKGIAARRWLDNPNQQYDFILATGDDRTDEELFRELPDMSWSIKVVGDTSPSAARCWVESHDAMLALLDDLVQRLPESSIAGKGAKTITAIASAAAKGTTLNGK